MKYPSIRINKCIQYEKDTTLPSRLNYFFKSHLGWEIEDDYLTLDTIITFISPDTYKEFLVEFVERDKKMTQSSGLGIEYLNYKEDK